MTTLQTTTVETQDAALEFALAARESALPPFDGHTNRVVLVSNRLPYTVQDEAGVLSLGASSGGLASGLLGVFESRESTWIGWPGVPCEAGSAKASAIGGLLDGRRLVPVHMDEDEVSRYYEEVGNGILWPLLHSSIETLPLELDGWDTYRAVNQRFADTVCEEYREGDLIWVHDYHLALVPLMVRQRLPQARIGFFLHVPFPSPEVFAVFPWRDEFLRGVLGADVAGFQTTTDAANFLQSTRRVAWTDKASRVLLEDRHIQVDAFPIGVDAARWEALGNDPGVQARAAEIREASGGRKIVLGVDRLDYTKGILRRFLAIQRALGEGLVSADDVRFVQFSAPSRTQVPAYETMRKKLDELAGHINSNHTSLGAVPLHHICKGVDVHEIAALYLAADVMLVTPLRDGMNLVAKEFVATRNDGDGVLVLSQFAGAAHELGEAMMVNPYDVAGTARTIASALEMPEAQRRESMHRMRAVVRARTSQHWANNFLEQLHPVPPATRVFSTLGVTPLHDLALTS